MGHYIRDFYSFRPIANLLFELEILGGSEYQAGLTLRNFSNANS